MNWSNRFQSHPQFGQAIRVATGRPPWVLKATGFVASIVFIIPVILLVLTLIAAGLVTLLAWSLFSTIAKTIDLITGQAKPQAQPSTVPGDEGRENVRVINRN